MDTKNSFVPSNGLSFFVPRLASSTKFLVSKKIPLRTRIVFEQGISTSNRHRAVTGRVPGEAAVRRLRFVFLGLNREDN